MLYNQSGDMGKGNNQARRGEKISKSFFKLGQLYFYLFLNVPNY